MAGPTFFSSIRLFFHMLWASVVRVFAFKKDVDVEPRDIEAGLQPSLPIKELPTDLNYESKPATCFLIPLKDGFVEIDLNTESTVASKRLTCTTTLSADSYVVDSTLREAQDRVIDVLKSVIISPGIVTTTPCSAEVEYLNLRIVGTNGHIRMSKQSFAELSVIQKAQFEPSEDGSAESDSVKALILPRSATIRYVKRLPKYKLRAVQFALPPIEIPDVFSSRYAEPNRNSDLFDLLDQFPTPPPNVDPVLSPPTISPEKSGRFARRYCIYRKADAGDESMSSSGGDATVLSISVSGDTLESSALDTPDSGNFSSVIPGSFREEPDALLRHSRNLPQVLADLNDSPVKATGSLAVLCKEDQRLSSAIAKECDGHDMSSRIGSGDDSDSTDEAAFAFPYHLRNILASSSSDDSDTTVDRLRIQLEELSFDSVKRPHSLVWFADRNLTKSPRARSSSGLLLAKVNGKGQPDLVLTEGLHSRESLEDVLKVIRDPHVDDLDYRELFWRDSSFCRSSLAKRVTTRSSGAARNESLKPFSHSFESPDRSARDILAMLNLPDPTEAGADDSSWILSSEEMGTDILSPDEFLRRLSPNDDSFRDQGVHDLFTWLAAVDEDAQKADISISDDGDDQWHDAVLYLDASM